MGSGKAVFHLIAIVTSALWGTTFISSKILLAHGLTPAEIMSLRFVMAYICILPFVPRPLFAKSWRDEVMMAALGISGGSLYFLLENTALLYTQASNVAIIIASTPLLTTLAVHLTGGNERVGRSIYFNSLLSLAGVALVVFNGQFILRLNPMGDLLTLGAAVLWVVYSLIILRMKDRYNSLFITRKIFFYGVVTLLPYFIFSPPTLTAEMLAEPVVAGNMIYLGIIASLVCYWTWNLAIDRLGAVRATNYLYINPVVAMITAYAVLDERITALAVVGTALILYGVYRANR